MQVRVNDLKRVRLPELNQAFLDSIGVESLDELREAVRETLKRRIETEQRQAMRRQILDQLLAADAVRASRRPGLPRGEEHDPAGWSAQLKREGMSDNEIRRQRSPDSRQRPRDDPAVAQGAAAAGQDRRRRGDRGRGGRPGARDRGDRRADRRERSPGPRSGREGRGADSLATQILERKVIDRILEDSEIEDVAVEIEPEGRVETLDITATAPRDEPRRRSTEVGKRRRIVNPRATSRSTGLATSHVPCPWTRLRARAGRLGLDSEGPFHAA